MTPKEKAQQMFDNYFQLVNYPTPNWKSVTKRCAIIAVDEIVESDWFIPTLRDKHEWTSYWKEVKTEIEKI